ncbi:hypothetical protein BD413DRAFT_294078 [Trametes elegans]|nr:hypothetical protein BD413DRAFT_294078 [Trametes elegans]
MRKTAPGASMLDCWSSPPPQAKAPPSCPECPQCYKKGYWRRRMRLTQNISYKVHLFQPPAGRACHFSRCVPVCPHILSPFEHGRAAIQGLTDPVNTTIQSQTLRRCRRQPSDCIKRPKEAKPITTRLNASGSSIRPPPLSGVRCVGLLARMRSSLKLESIVPRSANSVPNIPIPPLRLFPCGSRPGSSSMESNPRASAQFQSVVRDRDSVREART